MSGRLLGQELYARVAKALADYYDRLDQLKVICSDKKTYLNEAVRESVKLCVFLERSHPFTDGNCRVLIMQLLPKLLCDLGFGDIYIFEDPNRFDLYSLDQCVEEVIKALEHAQDITNCRSSLLTKVCGSNFLKDLASQKQSDYFNQCTREYIEITELAEFSTSYYRIDKDTEQRVLDLFTAYNRTECSWFAYLKNEGLSQNLWVNN